jgi:hypothetical protein
MATDTMSWQLTVSLTFTRTEVGGTHPALIECMGRGALVLYLDTKENAEVASGPGIPLTRIPSSPDGDGASDE